jgi:aminopeptidase N
MKFFEEKFKVAYPFPKYDQVFIKDCSFGAMENAGIVTFNEPNVIPREKPTEYNYYRIALIVSHELSHHWFGNYVTMTWWDDLWLNESFA